MTGRTPSIGDIAHYTGFGTPGGEYGKECRAAIITDIPNDPDRPTAVGVMVCNPTGIFFKRVDYDDGAEVAGDPNCPDAAVHGDPFRYCACGWMEGEYKGGTWHWPERT